MSNNPPKTRLTVPQIRARKGCEPIVALTAYHAHFASLADEWCDFLLVGDSVGMVVYGLTSTLTVSLEMMIAHGSAVVRATKRSLIVVDMPFGSYEENPQQAFRNAARIMAETGAGAVKLEGGEVMAETVYFLSSRGIPVMGHIGLTPQSSNVLGGFKTQGRDEASWTQIERDATSLEQAGAFALVIEGVVEPLAIKITQNIKIPTIGIGASNACDGQILVMEDMLGLSNRSPKFVRLYGALGEAMTQAFSSYQSDVKSRRFPADAETYR